MTGTAPLLVLDAAAVRNWCRTGCTALGEARAEIDALNVYPVPDGDTGTNLLLTMQAVVDGLAADTGQGDLPDLPHTVRTIADAALRGARGSSGVIFSQLLRGLAEVLSGCESATGADVQHALSRAAETAYAAVAHPAEGTVLTVARSAAKGAAEADPADLAAVVTAAADAARAELARTRFQLPQLVAADLVDAGGRGLVVLLDALAAVVTGVAVPTARAGPADRRVLVATRESGSDAYTYEVEFLLDAPDDAVDGLRSRLDGLGDALVIVGGGGLHHVHVHVNDVGAAIEAGVDAGRPHRISVTRFADQIAAESQSLSRVVAVAPAGGIAELFRAAGADVLEGDRDNHPSMSDVQAAIERAGVEQVVVLPNAREMRAVADNAAAAARAAGRTVIVVPTRSPVQGLAAVAVHDASRRCDDDVVSMSAAAAATRYAEVTHAIHDAQTSAGRCRTGDVLGLIDDDVALIGDDVGQVARGLLERMLVGGGELVTIVVGSEADPRLGGDLADHVATLAPSVETVVYVGGQPHYPLLIGVE